MAELIYKVVKGGGGHAQTCITINSKAKGHTGSIIKYSPCLKHLYLFNQSLTQGDRNFHAKNSSGLCKGTEYVGVGGGVSQYC